MVLKHVPENPSLVVVTSAVGQGHGLRDRYLDVVDIVSVPDRLKNGVGEPHDHQVLDGFLAQVVVDTEYLVFCERGVDRFVQPLSRG